LEEKYLLYTTKTNLSQFLNQLFVLIVVHLTFTFISTTEIKNLNSNAKYAIQLLQMKLFIEILSLFVLIVIEHYAVGKNVRILLSINASIMNALVT